MVQGQLGAQFETIDLDETGMADVCFTLPLGMPVSRSILQQWNQLTRQGNRLYWD